MSKGAPQTATETVQLERLDVPSRELLNPAGEFREAQPGLAATEFSFAGAERIHEKQSARSLDFGPSENLETDPEVELSTVVGSRRRFGRRRFGRIRKLLLGTRGLDVITKIMRWLERLLSSLIDRVLGERRNQTAPHALL